MISLALACSSCAWWSAHSKAIDKTTRDAIACVLAHYAGGNSPEQAAEACGGLVLSDVVDIFASAKRAGLSRAASVP